ncbi:MAG: hypothetical protein VCE74_18440 [Alphaproteobacteria bacterium]
MIISAKLKVPVYLLQSLFLGLFLAACTDGQSVDTDRHPVAKAPITALDAVPAVPAPMADDTVVPQSASQQPASQQPALNKLPATTPAATLATTPVVPPTPAPPATPAMKSRQLVGLDRGGLNSLLGKPTLLRQEASAEVWQYVAPDCVLHVFLYRDGGAGLNDPYRVVYVDAVRRGQRQTLRPAVSSSTPLDDKCLGRLLHHITAAHKTS